MWIRITQQLWDLRRAIQGTQQDPDYPELCALAEAAGVEVDMPRLLAYYERGYGIHIERARCELGGGDG